MADLIPKTTGPHVKRLTFLVCLVMAFAVMPGPAAQAELPVPTWAKKALSLEVSPASIVATAPKGEPLKVVITRRTSTGPAIDSIVVSSAAEARRLIAGAQSKDATIGVDMAQPVHMAVTNDTYRSDQWALNTLRAETAWRSSLGTGVTVAVIDTGVQSTHPDLAGKVLGGRDFVDRDTSPADGNGHGTHVAGIIASIANNDRGIAGLTRNTKILPIRVLDSNGEGDTATVAEGISWATDQGAQVLNLSLAATASDTATKSAIAYAISRNVVVVAAAGNSGCGLLGSLPVYPAAYPDVIGVGSIESGGAISDFSTCGSWVDLAAPGGQIVSTMIPGPNAKLGCEPAASYCYLSGTSMATPYVAAAAALAIEAIGSTWSQSGVQSILTSTATDLGAAGLDTSYGYGLINPVAMLRHIDSHIALRVPTVATIAGSPVTLSGGVALTDGTALAGIRVNIASVFGGTRHSYNVTTDEAGAFSLDVALPHNVYFTARYAGNGRTDDSKTIRAYNLVRPKWVVKHSTTRAYISNFSRYGQKLSLQKRTRTGWKNVASTTVNAKSWSAPAARGTWRFYSGANSKLAARASTNWTN